MNYIFPISFMANTYAMTLLLIFLGLLGKLDMAAEVGVIQGAMLALFYAFSANARSLILSQTSKISAQSILASRLALLIPFAGLAYFLSMSAAHIGVSLVITVILRRCVEWLGEVHLSDMERSKDKYFAKKYFTMQAILLGIVFVWVLIEAPYLWIVLIIWALTPLTLSAVYIWKTIVVFPTIITKIPSSILPHLGSTAIIGATVYVFRLLILFLLGKSASGELFTAFAIGGVTGGVFATVLGPSLVLHEQRIGKKHFPAKLRLILGCSLVVGIFLFVIPLLSLPWLDWTRRSHFFWMATGLSLIGGNVMVFAQQIRFRLLQHDEEHNVFGPDVMMNILLIAAVPFVYYLLGQAYMVGLYLISSLLAFVIYLSSKRGSALEGLSEKKYEKIRMMIGVMLLFPVFFQISNGVFKSSLVNFNAGGEISLLPVPISVFACFVGIILLGGYKKSFIAFSVIFFTFLLMMITTIISTNDSPLHQQSKLILLIQFILPMFGLVLGQMYNKTNIVDDYCYEKMFFYVLLMIVPIQLIITWLHGSLYLLPFLGFFSVYQHLQYVPVIFTSAYLLALFSLWQYSSYRKPLLILTPMMLIYVSMSNSVLAIGMFLIGFLLLVTFQKVYSLRKISLIFLFLVGLLSCLQYLTKDTSAVAYEFYLINNLEVKVQNQSEKKMVLNANTDLHLNKQQTRRLAQQQVVLEPINYWQYYYNKIISTPQSLLLGNDKVLDRSKYPSAHNYYLDFIFNFGLISILPLLGLVVYTFVLVLKAWGKVLLSSSLLGLCVVTFFLIMIDNSLKVGLRQPYSGIFTFFLWGVLVGKLSSFNLKEKNVV